MQNKHRACLPRQHAQKAIRNWQRTLQTEMSRAKQIGMSRLPKRTWERVANAASQLAHFGRCVQFDNERRKGRV